MAPVLGALRNTVPAAMLITTHLHLSMAHKRQHKALPAVRDNGGGCAQQSHKANWGNTLHTHNTVCVQQLSAGSQAKHSTAANRVHNAHMPGMECIPYVLNMTSHPQPEKLLTTSQPLHDAHIPPP
jgi:hypothetical protein